MPLRPELRYRPPNPELVKQLRNLLNRFEELSSSSGDTQSVVNAINQLSGAELGHYALENYWRSTSMESFLDQAAQTRPRSVPDIRREELIEIVELWLQASSEPESNYYEALFDAQVTFPGGLMGAFQVPTGVAAESWDPSPAEVVDIARAHVPIRL